MPPPIKPKPKLSEKRDNVFTGVGVTVEVTESGMCRKVFDDEVGIEEFDVEGSGARLFEEVSGRYREHLKVDGILITRMEDLVFPFIEECVGGQSLRTIQRHKVASNCWDDREA